MSRFAPAVWSLSGLLLLCRREVARVWRPVRQAPPTSLSANPSLDHPSIIAASILQQYHVWLRLASQYSWIE